MEQQGNQHPWSNQDQAHRVAYLVAGFIRKDLSPAERDELDEWLLEDAANLRLFEHLTDENELGNTLSWFQQLDTEKKLAESKADPRFHQPVLAKQPTYWPYWMAAAVIVVMLAFWWLQTRMAMPKDPEMGNIATTEIPPGSAQAVLVMENGKKVNLNETAKDTILEHGVQVKRSFGELVYPSQPQAMTMAMHRLIVPRKGMYKAVLPDGTRVWLNASSSLSYPNQFAGKERRVELTGEGYFEVVSDPARPFIVRTGEEETTVLGTRFNIRAYETGKQVTSLVEGKVKLNKGTISKVLIPGQQASFDQDHWAVNSYDQEQLLGWINDIFLFRNTPVKDVMEELARWYDIEPVFKDKLDFHLNATIPRHLPLTKLLSVLEKTGHGHYRLEGRTIIITR
ncbi:FecR domain-containing protein [Flavihumibacter rivuli]|uniref:FecR family protein n=1 Tax=Flavihumibacter rivuli TaxID=2838156 RepID=UPI001BDF4D66|nr:FecR family protein [Flavihumibacter rivuli]ULQ55449.1 FecR domain-containing protein [Flavihumibacter rivuli]